jgi:hypothetical protein
LGFVGSELLMIQNDNAIAPAFRHPPDDLRFDTPNDGALPDRSSNRVPFITGKRCLR